MTNQELFDTVSAHLLKQNERSASGNGECLYRGPSGLKCAIGCLIPDDRYTPDLEGVNACGDQVSQAAGLDSTNTDLVRHLQILHDEKDVYTWHEELKLLGKEYGLDTSKVPA